MEIRELDSAYMLPRISICRTTNTGGYPAARTRSRISEYYELSYYIDGDGSVFINGEENPIHSGDVRFTRPGTELCSLPHWRCYTVYFDFGEAGVIYKNPILDGIPEFFHAGNEPTRVFEKMLRLFHSASLTATAELSALLLSLLCTLYNGLHTPKRLNPAIRACIYYMERNFSSHISLEDLCSLSGYSKPQLLRLFKRELCCTPHDYLTSLRINHAKRMLTETGAPLTVISEECGFSSDSHFKTLFKKVTGLTPGSYRSTELPAEGE